MARYTFEVEKFERMAQRLLLLKITQQVDLGVEPLAPFVQRGLLLKAPEVQLIDDVKDINFKPHHVHLRPASPYRQGVTVRFNRHKAPLEAKYGQEVGEVAFNVAQRTQEVDFAGRK